VFVGLLEREVAGEFKKRKIVVGNKTKGLGIMTGIMKQAHDNLGTEP